jgi:hypothetical protein
LKDIEEDINTNYSKSKILLWGDKNDR